MYNIRLIEKKVAAGSVKEFDAELIIGVMDYIKIFEDDSIQVRFYDRTEFECEKEKMYIDFLDIQ